MLSRENIINIWRTASSRGGGFDQALAEALIKADDKNLDRLYQAFPHMWSQYGTVKPVDWLGTAFRPVEQPAHDEPEVYAYETETGKPLYENHVMDMWEDALNDVYDVVDVCGYDYLAGQVLREVDPTAFREGLLDWLDTAFRDGDAGIVEHYSETDAVLGDDPLEVGSSEYLDRVAALDEITSEAAHAVAARHGMVYSGASTISARMIKYWCETTPEIGSEIVIKRQRLDHYPEIVAVTTPDSLEGELDQVITDDQSRTYSIQLSAVIDALHGWLSGGKHYRDENENMVFEYDQWHVWIEIREPKADCDDYILHWLIRDTSQATQHSDMKTITGQTMQAFSYMKNNIIHHLLDK